MNRLAKWALFLAIAAGACSTHDGDPVSTLWFSVNRGPKGALQVLANNSFEFLASPDSGSDSGSMMKRGSLEETTVSALRGYFTDENIRHYIEGYQNFTGDCRQQGIVIFWGQKGIIACWYPTEVSDPTTSAMLEYVDNLFDSVANH